MPPANLLFLMALGAGPWCCVAFSSGLDFLSPSPQQSCFALSERTNTNPEEERYFLLRRVEQWFNLERMCKLVVVLPIILYEN